MKSSKMIKGKNASKKVGNHHSNETWYTTMSQKTCWHRGVIKTGPAGRISTAF